MSTSSQMGTTGIFAKMVAKFLVKWIKKTMNKGSGSQPTPALSAVPSEVAGRPDRDRAHENLGAHTGYTGPRASEMPQQATALQGGTYGTHAGSSGPRASEMPQQATALQGGTYGKHRGVTTQAFTCEKATYDPAEVERRLAAMWNTGEREARSAALRAADAEALRAGGMNDNQLAQAGNGRVPSGYQMEKVPASEAAPSHYQLAPLNQQSQCNCNAVNDTIFSMQFGNVSLISLPIGGQQVTIVLGGAAVLAG